MSESLVDRIVGTWVNDPLDLPGIRCFGRVSVEFKKDGRLIYTIHAAEKDQIILLTYRITGDQVTTDQPSASKERATSFAFTSDERLVLSYEDKHLILIRQSGAALH